MNHRAGASRRMTLARKARAAGELEAALTFARDAGTSCSLGWGEPWAAAAEDKANALAAEILKDMEWKDERIALRADDAKPAARCSFLDELKIAAARRGE